MEILKLLQQNSLPCYRADNKMITGGRTGSGIGMPQRIRVTTWNQTHDNYTECVKSERVGVSAVKVKSLAAQAIWPSPNRL